LKQDALKKQGQWIGGLVLIEVGLVIPFLPAVLPVEATKLIKSCLTAIQVSIKLGHLSFLSIKLSISDRLSILVQMKGLWIIYLSLQAPLETVTRW